MHSNTNALTCSHNSDEFLVSQTNESVGADITPRLSIEWDHI